MKVLRFPDRAYAEELERARSQEAAFRTALKCLSDRVRELEAALPTRRKKALPSRTGNGKGAA